MSWISLTYSVRIANLGIELALSCVTRTSTKQQNSSTCREAQTKKAPEAKTSDFSNILETKPGKAKLSIACLLFKTYFFSIKTSQMKSRFSLNGSACLVNFHRLTTRLTKIAFKHGTASDNVEIVITHLNIWFRQCVIPKNCCCLFALSLLDSAAYNCIGVRDVE